MVISIYVKVAEHSFSGKMLYPFTVNVFIMRRYAGHELLRKGEEKQPGEKCQEIMGRNLFCFGHL